MEKSKNEVEVYKLRCIEYENKLNKIKELAKKSNILLDTLLEEYESEFERIDHHNIIKFTGCNSEIDGDSSRDLKNGEIGFKWVWEYRKILTLIDIAFEQCHKIEEISNVD